MIVYFLKGSTRFFVISVLSSFLLSILQMITPRIVSVTVDSIIGNRPPEYPKIVSMLGGTQFLRENIWVIALISAAVGIVTTAFGISAAFTIQKARKA